MIKYLTEQELKKFFDYLDSQCFYASSDYQEKLAYRNSALFRVMYYCGLRVSELSRLKTEFYKPIPHELYCSRQKGGIDNTLRTLVEKYQVLTALERHIRINQPQNYLFTPLHQDTPISRKQLDKLIKRSFDAAGINQEKAHCHVLRHTCAIQLAEMGYDGREIQFWLGHRDIRNTLIYLTFTTRQQEHMYRKYTEGQK